MFYDSADVQHVRRHADVRPGLHMHDGTTGLVEILERRHDDRKDGRMTGTKHAFWEVRNDAFAPATPEMDLLHPDARTRESGPELMETQYLGFNVPEHGIHGLCYLWHHLNLGVVTGGAWVWQGYKENSLACELFDMPAYVDDACLAGDLWDYRLPNSYQVTTEKPLHSHRIRYSDPDRGNSFDVGYEAIMEPMVFRSGQHFEQGARATGELTLGGRTYEVDSYTVRDRS